MKQINLQPKPIGIYNFSPYIYYRNEQLMKDCCLIPYSFHKYFGYRSVIVTAQSEPFTYLQHLPGLEIDVQPMQANNEEWVELCKEYITQNHQNMDILFCFGAYPTLAALVSHYKKEKPDGKVMLKLDANIYWVDRIPLNAPLYKHFLDNCDVITVESKRLKKHLSLKWPYSIDYLPNGSLNLTPRESIHYNDKKNIILTVGRIGTEQKANHILLEAFRNISHKIPSWSLRLVGSIEESFKAYIDQYFEENPELRDRVIFTGKIIDKATLENEYKQAKIFALTSIFEGGTPNVWSEAARNGCYMVCSKFDAHDEATNWERCGKSFEINNIAQLTEILLNVCPKELIFMRCFNEIQLYHSRYFDFEKIVHKLKHLIQLRSGDLKNNDDEPINSAL